MVFISEQCVLCKRLGELFNKRHRVWFCLFPPATNKPVCLFQTGSWQRAADTFTGRLSQFILSLPLLVGTWNSAVLSTWHQNAINYRWMNSLPFSRCIVFTEQQQFATFIGLKKKQNCFIHTTEPKWLINWQNWCKSKNCTLNIPSCC